MSNFETTPPIPYVPIADKATEVRAAIDAARLSAANSFGGLQKLAIPGPFATDAEANTFGVPDDNLYYRSDGTVRAASHISLDLAFALDKTLTARTGPTPTFSRASSGLFVNANGILVGKTAGTTDSLNPTTTIVGTTEVTVAVASGSVVGWLVGQSVSLIVDLNANNAPDTGELWLVGDIVSTTATQLVFRVTSKGSTSASATAWTLGYRGARFDHDATGVCKGLLIEEGGRTNALQHSSNFKNTTSSNYWENLSATTVTVDQITSPDGEVNADLLTTSTASFDCLARRSGIFAGSTQYTYSIFLKQGPSGYRYVGLYIGVGITALRFPFFDFNNPTTVQIPSGTMVGTINSTRVDAYQDGWYRVSVTFTTAATPVTTICGVYISQSDGTLPSSSAAGLDAYIWGIQVEAGAFPTSYIPTTSGTAARSADVCSIIGSAFASFYNQSEGTFVSTTQLFSIGNDYTARYWGVIKTGFSNYMRASVYSQTATQEASFFTNNDNTLSSTVASELSRTSRVAAAYQTNNAIITKNGTLGILDDSFTAYAEYDALGIMTSASGHIARIQYFRKRLPNAKLQTLTAP